MTTPDQALVARLARAAEKGREQKAASTAAVEPPAQASTEPESAPESEAVASEPPAEVSEETGRQPLVLIRVGLEGKESEYHLGSKFTTGTAIWLGPDKNLPQLRIPYRAAIVAEDDGWYIGEWPEDPDRWKIEPGTPLEWDGVTYYTTRGYDRPRLRAVAPKAAPSASRPASAAPAPVPPRPSTSVAASAADTTGSQPVVTPDRGGQPMRRSTPAQSANEKSVRSVRSRLGKNTKWVNRALGERGLQDGDVLNDEQIAKLEAISQGRVQPGASPEPPTQVLETPAAQPVESVRRVPSDTPLTRPENSPGRQQREERPRQATPPAADSRTEDSEAVVSPPPANETRRVSWADLREPAGGTATVSPPPSTEPRRPTARERLDELNEQSRDVSTTPVSAPRTRPAERNVAPATPPPASPPAADEPPVRPSRTRAAASPEAAQGNSTIINHALDAALEDGLSGDDLTDRLFEELYPHTADSDTIYRVLLNRGILTGGRA